jgi:putative colanic acid biosynthesis UDP-glucose lipid carrier transferase
LSLRFVDAGLVGGGLFVISKYLDQDLGPKLAIAAVAAAAIFVLLGELQRLYGSWRLESMDDEFRSLFIAWALTCASLIVSAFLLKVSDQYSRLATIVWFLTTPALLINSRLAARLMLRWLRKGGMNMRAVAIAGAGPLSKGIIEKLEQTGSYGVRIAGIYDDRAPERLGKEGSETTRLIGTLNDLIERARKGELDYIFIAMPLRAEKRIVQLVNRLADTTASVYVIPDLFVFDLMRARWTTLGGLPAVSVYESPFDGLSGWVKRTEDLILGSTLLAFGAIPMALIAVALRLTSPGSVFFRQQRYGLNGRVVRVWKFRTMTVSEDGPNVVQARQHDPRITPLGRILRATSLDELPQLFNVLSGEMSLVGPRPHAVVVNEEYRRLIHGYMLRHKVKPGITGWAQVNGWHGDDTVEKMQQRVDHDLAYLQNWSLWLDLKILFLTVLAVFGRSKGTKKAGV